MPRLAAGPEETGMKIGDLLNRLQKVKTLPNKEFAACCPAHEDKKPSLSIKEEGDRILIHCQAGCSPEDIMATLNLTVADLFTEDNGINKPVPPPAPSPQKKIIKTYDYRDTAGNDLFQVVRFEPKSFAQRHRNGDGNWTWSMEGVTRVLYKLPEITNENTVVLVEGEKDADNLWASGCPATTSPGGANAWNPAYANSLAGKAVIIIPDRDAPGYSYARAVANSLDGKAKSVQVIFLPPPAKDVSDWIEAGGNVWELTGMAQDIDALFADDQVVYAKKDDAIAWVKKEADFTLTFKAEKISEERTGVHARVTIVCNRNNLAWSYLNIERAEDRTRLANQASALLKSETYGKDDMRRDLDQFCAGLWTFHCGVLAPEALSGDDTQTPVKFLLRPYIIEGGGTTLFAAPGRGKSNTALLWAVSIDAGVSVHWQVTQAPTLFINLERSRQSLARRLAAVNRALGLPATRPLLMLNARGRSLADVLPACRRAIKDNGIKFVVLDSVSRAGYGDLNDNQPTNRIVDALSSLSDSWLALAHTSRANEEHSFGSIMMDAGADICVMLSSQTTDDGTLGLSLEITKQNDIGKQPVSIWAYEFGEYGLTAVRRAKPHEFPDIEGKAKRSMVDAVMDFILNSDSGDASPSEISEATGFSRQNVSGLLNDKTRFVQTRTVKNSRYYGLLAR